MVQETQSSKGTDMTCFKMLPIKATISSQLVLMSLDLLVDLIARSDFTRSSLSPEVWNTISQASLHVCAR